MKKIATSITLFLSIASAAFGATNAFAAFESKHYVNREDHQQENLACNRAARLNNLGDHIARGIQLTENFFKIFTNKKLSVCASKGNDRDVTTLQNRKNNAVQITQKMLYQLSEAQRILASSKIDAQQLEKDILEVDRSIHLVKNICWDLHFSAIMALRDEGHSITGTRLSYLRKQIELHAQLEPAISEVDSLELGDQFFVLAKEISEQS